MSSNFIFFIIIPLLYLLFSPISAEIAAKPGVNYGQLGNNLPSPEKSVEIIKTLKAGRVKIYDANPPLAIDCLEASFPPSSGKFRSVAGHPVKIEKLKNPS